MKALIIVDVQNDFCPGGALAVKDGDAIISGINLLSSSFSLVVTTQDYHPNDHGSFASNHPGTKPFEMGTLGGREQLLWPDHCVQGSRGAELHPSLKVQAVNFTKGNNAEADSYSGFFDDDGTSTGLKEYLTEMHITKVYICGLAIDYCVKYTAMDALKQGFITYVIEDLCRGVNMQPKDSENALLEMTEAGVKRVTMDEIL